MSYQYQTEGNHSRECWNKLRNADTDAVIIQH